MAAIDDGMEQGIKKALGLLDDVNDGLEEQNETQEKIKKNRFFDTMAKGAEKASKAWGRMMDGVTRFNIADISSQMRNLTGETGNLSNSLESTMVGMIQSTKPIAATLDLSSEEMKKFASRAAGMAYGMNTSADAVAETMKSIHVANAGAKEAMDSLGMSTKDWVKVVQTTNVPMSEYTAILGDMTTSWQASPEDAAKMLDNLVAIGKVAGTGTGALKNAKVQLDELGEVFKTLPPSMARTSDEIMGLMESSARMSGVFREMGDTQDEAISKANTVARMFAEQDVAIRKALEIGDDKAITENPLMRYLMRLGVGFDQARDIVATGSRDSVKGMQMINEVYAQFGSDASPQVQRALSGLSGALGEGAAGLSYLAQNTTQGTEALAKMAAMAVKGDGALKKFGKDAYSSGLTLQDSYDRAKEAFDTTIRSIARQNVKGLVKKQIAGMREAGEELNALGSDKKWGPWINAISQFRQMGIGGVFASFAESTGVGAKNAAKMGSKIHLVLDTVKQFGSEFSSTMQMFGMLGPLGPLLAAGGIGALLMVDDSAAKSILGPLYKSFDKLKKKALSLWDEYYPRFKAVWDNQIEPKIAGFWKETMKPAMVKFWNQDFVPFLKDSAPKIGGAIWDGIKWAWSKLGEVTGVTGQAGVVGGAMVATMGPGMVGAGAEAGAAFLKAVASNPTMGGAVGLVGLAAYAGYKMTEAMMGPQSVKNAIAEAGVIAAGGDKVGMYMMEFEKDPKGMAKQLKGLRSALKTEKDSWFPDSGDVKTLEKAISVLAQAQSMLALEKTEGNVEAYGLGGRTTADQFVEGLSSGLKDGRQTVDDSLNFVTDGMQAHSPIQSGPLAGEGESNSAYRGGYFTMEQFGLGITSGIDMVKLAVEAALNESVITTMDEYAVKMKELAEQKTFLASVAKSMIRDMGASIEAPDPEANVNVKRSFEAAMNLPGLASVVLAVTNEGAATRKVLKRILDENVKQTSYMRPAASPGGGATRVPPAA